MRSSMKPIMQWEVNPNGTMCFLLILMKYPKRKLAWRFTPIRNLLDPKPCHSNVSKGTMLIPRVCSFILWLLEKNCVILEQSEKKAAELYVIIDFQIKEDLVGGVKAPRVNLNPNRQFVESEEDQVIQIRDVVKVDRRDAPEKGFESSRTAKLNMFSCMDAEDLETEFFPNKFKTRIARSEQL